jgi:phosphate uptake regulator
MDVERIGKLADALSKLTVVEHGDEKKFKIKNGKELFNMSQTVSEFQSTFFEPLRNRKKSPQKGMRFQTVFKL